MRLQCLSRASLSIVGMDRTQALVLAHEDEVFKLTEQLSKTQRQWIGRRCARDLTSRQRISEGEALIHNAGYRECLPKSDLGGAKRTDRERWRGFFP